jgi:polysaccharide biosynthesis protein PslG
VSRSGLLRVVVAVAAMATMALPASASALVIGIADQKPDMFSSPLFQSLDLRYARLAVSWDAMEHPWEIADVDAWLDDARAAGVQPLIGFGHSRVDRRALPTPSRFKYDFRQFRARYPWVTTFATWNEANHCGEPTCHRPQLVAAYYRSMTRECPKCTILGAELLDMPNMSKWVDQYRKHLGPWKSPRYWGLHNYIDANRLRTTGTRRLLAHTTGQIWFTETGGIVHRRNRVKVDFPESAAHAALATQWVFQKLVPLSRRITRVYLYHWNAVASANWDSGLVDPRGRGRPALRILRDEQRTLQRRQARRAAQSAAGSSAG